MQRRVEVPCVVFKAAILGRRFKSEGIKAILLAGFAVPIEVWAVFPNRRRRQNISKRSQPKFCVEDFTLCPHELGYIYEIAELDGGDLPLSGVANQSGFYSTS